MNVYMVRHARTGSNTAGRYMGWIDESIDPTERWKTDRVADFLLDKDLDAIYSSPLRRALQTASPLAERIGLEVTIEPVFGEMRMGAWEGLTGEEISARDPENWKLWRVDPAAVDLNGRESLDRVTRRVGGGLMSLANRHPIHNVVVFSHDAVVRCAAAHVLGVSPKIYRRIAVANSSISAFEFDNSEWSIGFLNLTAHLIPSGQSM